MTIIFVHSGNSYYLKYSICQARKVFASARIVLLGDRQNVRLSRYCEHREMSQYSKGADRFSGIYQHLSPNSISFELFCFKRWFIAREFISSEGIKGPIVCLDSDALVYEDVFGSLADSGTDIATTKEIGPAFTFFKDASILSGFCDFMMDSYRDDDFVKMLKTIFETGKSPFFLQGKYVSDMHLLGYFYRKCAIKADLSEERGGAVFDYAFHDSEGFLWNPYKRIKRIWWEGDRPYGEKQGRRIFFAGLHFQVGTKVFLPMHYRGSFFFIDAVFFFLVDIRGKITTGLKFILDGLGKSWRIHASFK